MKLTLRFEVDLNEEGLARYFAEYPAFQAEFNESPADVLIREAICAWDEEGLLVNVPGEETTTGRVIEGAS